MSTPKLELRSIDELIGHAFVIPSYQRGYRWSSIEVRALLDDLDEFRQAKRSEGQVTTGETDTRSGLGKFYCLQPVVVLSRGRTKDGREQWELIDGQQRLTTIYLIIRYLEEEARMRVRGSFTLTYETRASEYLTTLAPEYRWESPDSWYMYQAYETIKDWFKKKDFWAPKDMVEVLLLPDERSDFNTKVIWYELPAIVDDSHAEIDAFIRLNAGKIRLTNAELIRALFLKAGNFPRDLRNLSQINLAQEWDRIEKRLQDNRFWYFLHGGPSPYATRIDHLFLVYVLAHHPTHLATIPEAAEYRTFLAFQTLEKRSEADLQGNEDDGISAQWNDIKHLAMRLEEWNQDTVLYHLLGFWIAYRGALGDDNASVIVDLLARRATHKQNHQDFEEGLKANIFGALIDNGAPLRSLDNKQIRERVTLRLDELEYTHSNRKRNAEEIRPLLLLFNIATLLCNRSDTARFPFDLFSRQRWDIEHIRSVDSRRPGRPEDQRLWLATIVEYWTGRTAEELLPVDSDTKRERSRQLATLLANADVAELGALKAALGLPGDTGLDTSATSPPDGGADEQETKAAKLVARAWLLLAAERFDQAAKDDFVELYNEVLELFGEKEPIEADNSMGNLTLLDVHTNRSYRNAPFPMKRKTILALDKTGTFVPRCTTNVFLKYYSRRLDHMLSWTEASARSHQDAMATTLAAFFAPGGHRTEEVHYD